MGFSENLRAELDFQGIQIKELAQKTGISKNTLDKYLSGPKVQPGVENAVKIAHVLNVSVEYLVTGKTDIPSRLSSEYDQVLRKYQKLTPFNRKTVFDLLESISSRQGELKVES
ncbi:MAG: helix-turn-helix transcriptional regulator [Treponema sp.]|nr:helix-turn-helix transcriptional regulator [Treponema sp.]